MNQKNIEKEDLNKYRKENINEKEYKKRINNPENICFFDDNYENEGNAHFDDNNNKENKENNKIETKRNKEKENVYEIKEVLLVEIAFCLNHVHQEIVFILLQPREDDGLSAENIQFSTYCNRRRC